MNSFTISVVRSALHKQSRALGVGVAAQLVHQRDHSLGLFEIRSQLRLERDVAQILDAVGQFLLLIDVPEEARVVEARPQHALIAALDQALRIAAGVHHRDKVGREFAGRGFHREILLVMPHHRGQDFGGQFQNSRVEIAADGGGIFGDEGQGFDQIGIQFRAQLCDFGDDLLRGVRRRTGSRSSCAVRSRKCRT